jgi:pilus assembly protein CpaC
MKVTPKIQSETVDMSIDFSYDGLVGRQGTAPITLKHTYVGAVMVKNGESAALVNAVNNTISTAFNKDAPGGTTPTNPLFSLLRSKAFQKNKSQFVVFITPQIIESAATGTEDIKKRYGLKKK